MILLTIAPGGYQEKIECASWVIAALTYHGCSGSVYILAARVATVQEATNDVIKDNREAFMPGYGQYKATSAAVSAKAAAEYGQVSLRLHEAVRVDVEVG